jgi:hypothetical protein
MTATQDLIAAALTAADELDFIYKHAPVEHTTSDLREACARAMVQPAAPDMAEVERLADVYADHVFSDGLLGRKVPSEHAATAHAALLDYVRGIMAERDDADRRQRAAERIVRAGSERSCGYAQRVA